METLAVRPVVVQLAVDEKVWSAWIARNLVLRVAMQRKLKVFAVVVVAILAVVSA